MIEKFLIIMRVIVYGLLVIIVIYEEIVVDNFNMFFILP